MTYNVSSGTLNPTVPYHRKISFFRQCWGKLNMFNLFWFCRNDKISFDIVANTGNIVAETGNNVEAFVAEATFDFVERIVQLV